MTATCSVPGCITIAEPAGQCQRHLMEARRAAGLCANCGGARTRRDYEGIGTVCRDCGASPDGGGAK